MGTTNALETVLTRARALGLSIHLIDSFYDVDVEGDLNLLAAKLHLAAGESSTKTAAWLKHHAQESLRTGVKNP